MYRNLYIISEGRTESNFVKTTLSEHLINFGWVVVPTTLPTSHGVGRGRKGGWRSADAYKYAKEGIRDMIATHGLEFHTTFFDLYGFPADIPCYKAAAAQQCPIERAKLYEQQIKSDVCALLEASNLKFNKDLFVPYIQPYEVEAFMFVDPKLTAEELMHDNPMKIRSLEGKIQDVKQRFPTPEHINSGNESAPSKRLESFVPGYEKNKAGKSGFSWMIPKKVGLAQLRSECNHFNEWLTLLEKY